MPVKKKGTTKSSVKPNSVTNPSSPSTSNTYGNQVKTLVSKKHNKPLIIVESPAKCKKIEEFLDNAYNVIASYGHFRCIENLNSIDMTTFNIKYTPMPSKLSTIKYMKQMISMCDEVIIATDDDREGEAIGWHICDMFKLPVGMTKRILFHEITKTAIVHAVNHPTRINMQLVHAQQARQFIDMYIGYKISPILWKHINQTNSLSAGRCQTPALNLVFENHNEYEQQTPEYVYEVDGYFTRMNLPFKLNKTFDTFDKLEAFYDTSVEHTHQVQYKKGRIIKVPPPEPLITSSIQQHASNKFQMSPKETMRICQKLYENGYINYMRTDSKKYSKDFLNVALRHIATSYGDDHANHDMLENAIDVAEVNEPDSTESMTSTTETQSNKDSLAQEAHEALRIIQIEVIDLPDTFTPREQRLYRFIRNHTLETCMTCASVVRNSINISAPLEASYVYKSECVTFPGWKAVCGVDTKENEIYHFLNALSQDQTLDFHKVDSNIHVHKSKTHYTEASLIRELERRQIGRPSTYASIIDKLYSRAYVCKEDVKGIEKTFPKLVMDYDTSTGDVNMETITQKKEFQNEKSKVVIQHLGLSVIELCTTHFEPLFNYEFTAKMERLLDNVASNYTTYFELCDSFKASVDESIDAHQKHAPKKEKVMIEGKYEVIQSKYGLAFKYSVPEPVSDDEENTCLIDDESSSRKKKKTKNKVVFKNIKKNLTLDYIREHANVLTFDECIAKDKQLGVFNNQDVYLAKGQYGMYLKVNGKNIAVPKFIQKDKTLDTLTIADVYGVLKEKLSSPSSDTSLENSDGNSNSNSNSQSTSTSSAHVLRPIDENLHVRNGPYGPYLYYKTKKMKKAKFVPLKKYTGNYMTDDISKLHDYVQTYQPPAYRKQFK